MPESTEPPVPDQRGRSLTGFYIALGVVAALVGLGAWLWTPARIWYYERQFRAAKTSADLRAAAEKLGDVGPQALPAFKRLLQSEDSANWTFVLHSGLGHPGRTWALPLIVQTARDSDDEIGRDAIWAAENVLGKRWAFGARDLEDVPEARRRLLAWWEREGRAKYGAKE
jgi:hypothetical protein